jgi:hypothetical protein
MGVDMNSCTVLSSRVLFNETVSSSLGCHNYCP